MAFSKRNNDSLRMTRPMCRNKNQHLQLLSKPHIGVASHSVATTCVKVIAPRSVVVLVSIKISRTNRSPLRSQEERKSTKRRLIILQMEGKEIRGAKMKTPIL